jgi:predicted ArsR family transcriptional regulator
MLQNNRLHITLKRGDNNMSNTNTVTKENRVLEALRANDRGLTAAQIETRFGVGNARSTVSALRMKGFAIYANQLTDTKGRTKTFYRLGTPSRAVVAAGYRALAQGL